ncbi:MAG: hypothetical protein IJB16_04845 [Clostridia bacterium]|nr:hypothetical protein [Clostridia bacterium]
MDIVKVAFTGILTAVVYSFLRNNRPEIAPLAALGGASVILIVLGGKFIEILGGANNMMSLSGIGRENVSILLRSLGIFVVTQFAADVCYDNSCSALAAAVELAGKIGALYLAMPMLETVARLATGLLNG